MQNKNPSSHINDGTDFFNSIQQVILRLLSFLQARLLKRP